MKQQKRFVYTILWGIVVLFFLAAGCSKNSDDTMTAAPPAPPNAQPLPMAPKKNRPKLPPLTATSPTK